MDTNSASSQITNRWPVDADGMAVYRSSNESLISFGENCDEFGRQPGIYLYLEVVNPRSIAGIPAETLIQHEVLRPLVRNCAADNVLEHYMMWLKPDITDKNFYLI